MPLVVFADECDITEEALKRLNRKAQVVFAESPDEDTLVKTVSKADVIISEYAPISKRVMESAPRLKGIIVFGVGYNHIDLAAVKRRQIIVANARGSNAQAVAEHAVGMMLMLAKNSVRSDRYIRAGGWQDLHKNRPTWVRGVELRGKTVAVIGAGKIGGRVATICRNGFKMRVLKMKSRDPLSKLKQLLSASDFVTLHVPLNEKTWKMINARELGWMKPTAYLINTSRGKVLDEVAVLHALETGRIAGAALDVFNEEPIDANHPFCKLENVVLSPHNAGSTKESQIAISKSAVSETLRILANKRVKNRIV